MGKNQAYKAMQRARLGSSSAAPDEVEDGMVDGSFHTPEWHAARLANLNTSHTVTWEEFKRKQKEDELKKVELEADKERMMREYRAQLDAEREKKLAKGRNHASDKSKDRKDKDKTSKKHSSRKGKILAPPVMNPRAAVRMNESPKDQSQDQGQNPRDRRRKESEGQEASIQVVIVDPKAHYLSPGFSAASRADNLLKIPLWCFTIQRLLLVPLLNRLMVLIIGSRRHCDSTRNLWLGLCKIICNNVRSVRQSRRGCEQINCICCYSWESIAFNVIQLWENQTLVMQCVLLVKR